MRSPWNPFRVQRSIRGSYPGYPGTAGEPWAGEFNAFGVDHQFVFVTQKAPPEQVGKPAPRHRPADFPCWAKLKRLSAMPSEEPLPGYVMGVVIDGLA